MESNCELFNMFCRCFNHLDGILILVWNRIFKVQGKNIYLTKLQCKCQAIRNVKLLIILLLERYDKLPRFIGDFIILLLRIHLL